MGNHLTKVLVWQDGDDVSITHLHSNDMLPGETEDAFISRYSQKLRQNFSSDPKILSRSDIPSDKKDRGKWRLVGGKVKVDSSVVTPAERKKTRTASIKSKLMSGQPLSQEEVDDLVK
jgi:hypothetical protein